jgi:D-sedoheptulose 7-phosphate isomerase
MIPNSKESKDCMEKGEKGHHYVDINRRYLTCIANDWSYEDVFSRQVEAFGQKGDVLLVFSTSGKSPNILKAIGVAKSRNMLVLGALGKDGGPAKGLCDHAIVVPSEDTSRIQEIHGWLIHAWLECVEALVIGKS